MTLVVDSGGFSALGRGERPMRIRLKAAHRTGEYNDADRDYVRRIAVTLNVDEETVAALEDLHRREEDLKQERIALGSATTSPNRNEARRADLAAPSPEVKRP